MRRHIAYALGLIGMQSSALLALALAQPLYSAEWIFALILVPMVLGMLPLGLGLTEKGRDRVARVLHPIIAVLGLATCAACFLYDDRASLGFVFPLGLIGLNLTLPRERAVAFIVVACGALLMPLSAGNDIVLLLITLIYVFSLLLHLSGAFFRAMEEKDGRYFVAPAPGNARLIALTYVWTTLVAGAGGTALSWVIGETRAHPFSIELPAGGLLFNTAGLGADGDPLLSGGDQRLLSSLTGRLKGNTGQTGAGGAQSSEGRISHPSQGSKQDQDSQGSKGNPSTATQPGPAAAGAGASSTSVAQGGQAGQSGSAQAANAAASASAASAAGRQVQTGDGGHPAMAASESDFALIKVPADLPLLDDCGMVVAFPSSNPALRAVQPPVQRSAVLKVPVGFGLYLRQRAYGDYDAVRGAWNCDKPHLSLKPEGGRTFEIDGEGRHAGYTRTVTVLKEIGPYVPAPMRPRRLVLPLERLEVSESHALRAPKPLAPGQSYAVTWLEGSWHGDPPRPAAQDEKDTHDTSFLDVPAGLRGYLQAYLDSNFADGWGDQLQAGDKLEKHFRERFTHSLAHLRTAQEQGAHVDPVMRVLAEHRGHAEELATAFVLMARQLNMPARVVTGYVADRPLISGNQCCEVHQLDAHAWAEVRIGISWTVFDPSGFHGPPNNADLRPEKLTWRGYLESLDRLATAYDQTLPGFPGEPTAWVRNSTEDERQLLKLWHLYLWADKNWPWMLLAALAALGVLAMLPIPFRRLRYAWQVARQRDPRERVLAMYRQVERVSRARGVRRVAGEHHVAYLARCALRWPDWTTPLQTIADAFSLARYSPAPVDAAMVAEVNSAARSILFTRPREAPPPEPAPREERHDSSAPEAAADATKAEADLPQAEAAVAGSSEQMSFFAEAKARLIRYANEPDPAPQRRRRRRS